MCEELWRAFGLRWCPMMHPGEFPDGGSWRKERVSASARGRDGDRNLLRCQHVIPANAHGVCVFTHLNPCLIHTPVIMFCVLL